MRKKLIKNKNFFIVSFAIILLLVCLTGCQIRQCPDPDSGQVIPIQCITSQPEYFNKTVMIHSTFYIRNNYTFVAEPSIYWGDDTLGSVDINYSNAKNASILIDGYTYYFIGKFKDGIFYVIEVKPSL